MAFLDRVIAALTPPESDETRMEARRAARESAFAGGWLSEVIDQHEMIERAFDEVVEAQTADTRLQATKRLMVILTGHANAEESILYPEIADSGHKAHASLAYEEQAVTKVQLALLEKIEPMSQDYIDKLEHIRGAVTHHMYQEESNWFMDLQAEVPSTHQRHLAQRFKAEVEGYIKAMA